MFERFLGPESEEDRAALARVEVSAKEEKEIGQAALRAFLADLKRRQIDVADRGKDVEYLRALVEALRPRMANAARYRTIKVCLARSPLCEARSLPGGALVFFEGLLRSAGSEAALAVVVGHELSHLDRGHLLVRARRWKLAQQAFAGQARSFEEFFEAGASATRLWTRPFQPEDELEADRDGARWAYAAGYDPRAAARLFEEFAARKAGRLPLPEFLQSHPDPALRRRAMLAFYDELQRADPKGCLFLGEENLRRRVAKPR
jgi:predicted Zn-dependent protease